MPYKEELQPLIDMIMVLGYTYVEDYDEDVYTYIFNKDVDSVVFEVVIHPNNIYIYEYLDVYCYQDSIYEVYNMKDINDVITYLLKYI